MTEQRLTRYDSYGYAPDNDIDPYFDHEWFIDNIVKRCVIFQFGSFPSYPMLSSHG